VALALYDRVQQTGTANTTVSFTLSGSVTGFQSFSVVGDTNTTYYSAYDSSGNWEVGIGTYSTTGPTLARTTILSSSNANAAVTFSGTVAVLLTYPSSYSVRAANSGSNSEFPSGTALLFQQTAAPTGWTKSTAHDNKALRVVSGSASSGGTVAFTTAFASQAVSGTVGTSGSTTATGTNATVTGSISGSVGNTTLSTSQVPNASGGFTNHGAEAGSSMWSPGGICSGSSMYEPGYRPPNGSTGGANSIASVNINLGFGDGAHNHSFSGSFSGSAPTFTGTAHSHTGGAFTGTAINLAVQYVDAIICTKD